jgi:hypothetical protein
MLNVPSVDLILQYYLAYESTRHVLYILYRYRYV